MERWCPLVVASVQAGAADWIKHCDKIGTVTPGAAYGIPEGVETTRTYLSSKELSTKKRPLPGHRQVDADALWRGAALQ